MSVNINTDLLVALWVSVPQTALKQPTATCRLGLIFLVEAHRKMKEKKDEAEVGRLLLMLCCSFVSDNKWNQLFE